LECARRPRSALVSVSPCNSRTRELRAPRSVAMSTLVRLFAKRLLRACYRAIDSTARPRLLAGLRRQSDPALAATQGDMALHRSIDGEDSGQPEAEMAAGRNATGRRPRLAWPRRCDRASRRDEMSFRKRRAHPRPTRRLASCCRGWSGASTPGRLGLAPTPPWASCCPGSPAASGAVDR
jgi:hypothetical protein